MLYQKSLRALFHVPLQLDSNKVKSHQPRFNIHTNVSNDRYALFQNGSQFFYSFKMHVTVQVRTKRTKTYAYNASGPNAFTHLRTVYMHHGYIRSKLISMYELAHCFRIVDISLLF